jgi:hypothetical protein
MFDIFRTVDFAPEFANQLVATAVNAAGQAYITAKAVFKTWQDKQVRYIYQVYLMNVYVHDARWSKFLQYAAPLIKLKFNLN